MEAIATLRLHGDSHLIDVLFPTTTGELSPALCISGGQGLRAAADAKRRSFVRGGAARHVDMSRQKGHLHRCFSHHFALTKASELGTSSLILRTKQLCKKKLGDGPQITDMCHPIVHSCLTAARGRFAPEGM